MTLNILERKKKKKSFAKTYHLDLLLIHCYANLKPKKEKR